MTLFLASAAALLLIALFATRLAQRHPRGRGAPAVIGISLAFFLLVFQVGRLTLGA